MKRNFLLVSLLIALNIILLGCDKKETKIDNNSENNNSKIEKIESGENNNANIKPVIEQNSGEVISGDENNDADDTFVTLNEALKNAKADSQKYSEVEKNPIVTMVVKDYGTVKMELYPKIAPESVENFVSLINKGYYNGSIFSRTIPWFVAQGGAHDGNEIVGPGYCIVGEFAINGFQNELTHEIGLLSMARGQENNSAGAQFFIVTSDSTYLDGQYAGFGRVLDDGMSIINQIVNVDVLLREKDVDVSSIQTVEEYIEILSKIDRPVNPPVIESMTVDTFGVTYDEPQKIKR